MVGQTNPSAAANLINRFDERIASMAAMMAPEKARLFVTSIENERDKLFAEYQQNPIALKTRLNIQSTPHQITIQPTRSGQGFGSLVARTAIRATVWEIVRSFFRR